MQIAIVRDLQNRATNKSNMFSIISTFILNLCGFKITDYFPHDLKKFVIIVFPHTSYWDFPVGILLRRALKIDAKYLAKDSIFRPPFGWLFRWTGGYPVDRSKSNNFVQAVVDIFNDKEQFGIAMAPEGTRSKVDKIKTGFYYIALHAKVPIVMCKFDYGNGILEFSKPYHLSGDYEADFKIIEAWFKGIKGKNPELGYFV